MTDYASVVDVKAVLGITDSNDDTSLGVAVTAASRMIEEHCRRRFDQQAAVAKFYTPASRSVVFTDDLVSVTEVAIDYTESDTYGTTTTDYRLEPFNAADDNDPYTCIRLKSRATPLPMFRKSVRVTGTFGWPAVPDEVVQATILQAERMFKTAQEAPFGVAPLAQLDGAGIRMTERLDPTVMALLRPLRKMEQG